MSLYLEGILKLNPEQEKAVKHVNGPLLIFAGAGSGKTRVITNRIVHLIQNCNVSPSSIVALSFTNKSARELKERIRKMLGRKGGKGLELSTFHSLGLKICKEHLSKLGYKHPFILQTPRDLESIVADVMKQKKIDPKKFPPKLILSRISLWKNTGIKYIDKSRWNELDALIDLVYDQYIKNLQSENSLDFDDLILKPIQILKEFPDVASVYSNKYKFFMVDEFQDTNVTQYELIHLLLGNNKNLCVVGDDDQSIYGFRGSSRDLILNFERDFKNTIIIKLMQNYRSTNQILKAANSLIANNSNRKEKELWSNIYSTEKVIYREADDEREEAIMVADQIKEIMVKFQVQPKEITVLFRTNYQSRPFEEEFRMRSIPFKLIGAYSFFDRKEVKDIISYLRVIANHKDDLSLLRILNYPKRGLGDNTRFKIQEKANSLEISVWDTLIKITESPDFLPEVKKGAANIYEFVNLIQRYKKDFFIANKMSVVLKNLITELKFENEITNEETEEKVVQARMYNLSELTNMLSYFESEWDDTKKPDLFDFLLRISLFAGDDDNSDKEENNKVQLMTMHLSKGLEFHTVFLVGLEEGIIPSSRSMEEEFGIEEERRLMYVGITRAQRRLFLSSARNRKKFGETVPVIPSRFLNELDSESLDRHQNKVLDEVDFLEELEKLKAV
jgi:DNA helicase-2/ATP-dependent DNA helicase PcrA